MHFRRVRLAAAATASLAAVLAGCSSAGTPVGTTPPVAAKPPAAATASATPVSADPTGATTGTGTATSPLPIFTLDRKSGKVDYCKGQADFDGPAAAQFGAASVKQAYCEMVGFSIEQGFTDLMITKPARKPIEFSVVKAWMTPSAQDAWDKIVTGVLAHPKGPDYANVQALTLYNFDGGPIAFAKDAQELAAHQRFTSASTDVEDHPGMSADRLILHFDVSADVNMVRVADKKPVYVPVTKHLTYTLAPNGANPRPWLIDGWRSTFDFPPMRVITN